MLRLDQARSVLTIIKILVSQAAHGSLRFGLGPSSSPLS
jgi:hypothetical protein